MRPRSGAQRLTVILSLLAPLLLLIACAGMPAAPVTVVDEQADPSTTQAPAPNTRVPAGASGSPADAASRFLVYGNSGEPDSLDAMATFSGQALSVTEQIEEPLVGRVPGTTQIAPLLAETWTPNTDRTAWTFTLRRGVRFHDGTPFNADAVIFNFRRMAEPDFPFSFREQGKTYSAFADVFGGFAGEAGTAWQDIEKIDDSTTRISLTRPFPLLPEMLSASYFGISSPDAIKRAGAAYGAPAGGAIGTGAFKLESWTPGTQIVLVRNEDYWGDQARMPGVVVRPIDDAATRLTELQAGTIDLATNLPADARPVLKNDPELVEVALEPFNVAYIAMNLNDRPLDDARVRQAIAHAIDKREILDGFYGGAGVVADDFLPDSLAWARSVDAETYPHDPARARALLAEAGYPDGFSTMTLPNGAEVPLEFWYMPISRPYFSTPKPIAEAFAAQLAEVGVRVELKTEDWGVYLDNVDAGKKHGLWMLGWTGDYADPNNFLQVFVGSRARLQQGYENQTVIDLLQRAGSTATREEAVALFRQAAVLVANDVPRIPIVHAPPVYGAKKELKGWIPSPFGTEPWKSIYIAK